MQTNLYARKLSPVGGKLAVSWPVEIEQSNGLFNPPTRCVVRVIAHEAWQARDLVRREIAELHRREPDRMRPFHLTVFGPKGGVKCRTFVGWGDSVFSNNLVGDALLFGNLSAERRQPSLL
jgi:hypothetical protein